MLKKLHYSVIQIDKSKAVVVNRSTTVSQCAVFNCQGCRHQFNFYFFFKLKTYAFFSLFLKLKMPEKIFLECREIFTLLWEVPKVKKIENYWSKGPFPLRAWKKSFFVCFIAFFLRSLQF